MSFILDALRKAERERTLGQVPALSGWRVSSYVAPRRLPAWLIPSAGVLLLGIGLGWYWLLSKPPSEAEQVAVASASATPASAPPAEPAPEPPAQKVAVQTPRGPVEVELPPAAPSQPISEQPLAPGSTPPAAPVTVEAEAPATQEFAAEEPAIEAEAVEEVPVEEIGPDTPELPPEQALVQDLPSYNGLPENLRAAIPALNMNAHVYSSTPGRGFVLINGKKYRQGDQLVEGPKVVQILPDSVVLSYRGTDFLLPVPR